MAQHTAWQRSTLGCPSLWRRLIYRLDEVPPNQSRRLVNSLESRLSEALAGSYAIEGEIGRGGMGVVYRARDIKLQRPVAIKVLPPDLAFRADIRARFLREAQTAARLSHPHIVPIHIVGEAGDLVYFVMGLVDGESLAVRVKRRGRLSIDEARRVAKETADALAAAHQQGVIHRDVKPDNILLEGTRGRVMVTDFGIAKALSAETHTLTEAGVAIGTPAFMSPEQASGEKEIDGRSDVYSLGVVSYQMLSGELPFSAPTVPALLMKQITESPTPIDQKRPDIPRELAQIVMRCLEKEPDDRWPTADALRRALETGTYSPPPARARPPRSSGRPLEDRQPQARRAAERPGTIDRREARDWLAERRGEAAPSPFEQRMRDKYDRARDKADRQFNRHIERMDRKSREKAEEEAELVRISKETGEPLMVTRFRANLARYAAVNGILMTFSLLATHGNFPWYLVAGFWGIGIARQYARLWTNGYSWKDVIHRPPAPDSIEGKKTPRGLLASINPRELGAYAAPIEQARADRAAVLAMLEKLGATERGMLPNDLAPTVDRLLERAVELARTLALVERDIDEDSVENVEARIRAVEGEVDAPDKARRLDLLRQQKEKVAVLADRRAALHAQFESCVLAMQNVRFDLLRLRSAGVSEALGDLTQATQQARALSRDVDAAIGAANEVRKLTER